MPSREVEKAQKIVNHCRHVVVDSVSAEGACVDCIAQALTAAHAQGYQAGLEAAAKEMDALADKLVGLQAGALRMGAATIRQLGTPQT